METENETEKGTEIVVSIEISKNRGAPQNIVCTKSMEGS